MNNFWSDIDPEEKAREKQKKLEYSLMLKQQIEEKKLQKQIEKQKAIEEEIKYQVKYNNSFSNNPLDTIPLLTQSKCKQPEKTMELKAKSVFPQLASQEIKLNKTTKLPIPDPITLGYVEELFRMFVEEQIKVINDYERELDLSIAQDHFAYSVKNHKMKAIEQIQSEKHKLKTKLGFFPLENNYNQKIEELFDKILAKKVNKVTLESDIDAGIKDIVKDIDYKSKYIGNNDNDNNKNNNKTYNNNSQSIINDNSLTDFNNLPSEVQQSLVGFSKLVQINKNENNKEEENFLVTWRDNLLRQKSNRISNQKTIQSKEKTKIEEMNHNNKITEKEQTSFPNMQTEINQKPKMSSDISDIKKQRNESFESFDIKHQTNTLNNHFNSVIEKNEHNINEQDSNSDVFDLKRENMSKNRTMINNQVKIDFDNILNQNNNNKKQQNSNENENENVNVSKDNRSINIDQNNTNEEKDNSKTDIENKSNDIDNDYYEEEIEEDIQIQSSSRDNGKHKYHCLNKTNNDRNEYHNPLIINHNKRFRNSLPEPQYPLKKKIKTRYNRSAFIDDKKDKINPFHNTKEIEKLNAIVNNEIDISESDEFRDTFHQKRNKLPPQNLPPRNIASDSNRKVKNLYHSRDKYNNLPKAKPFSANKRNLIPKFNKDTQHHSENDSILNDLDKFRKMALNDIGSADFGNNQLSSSSKKNAKTKSIDLIPKNIIKNYSNVISSGVSNDNYY